MAQCAGMLPATAIDAGLCRWRARETAEAVGTMIVDRAMYRDGRRTAELLELGHMDDAFRAGGGWPGSGSIGRPSRNSLP